ncbi:MAG TPA: tetratricopeptide repeat protein [Candidatus Edwardsbacteria bacterium]|nr:tetratricopeptide repeat protein [Candidatus Edwardsbacteria bacterium]
MRRFVPFLLMVLTLPVLAASAQTRMAKIPMDQWQLAVRLAQEHRPQQALARFKQLLQGASDQVMTRSAASALRQAGALAEAEQLLLWAGPRATPATAFAQDLADLYQSQLRYGDAVHQLALALEDGAAGAAAGIDAIAVQAGYGKTAAWLQREPLKRDESLKLRGDLWSRAGDIGRAWDSYRAIANTPRVGMLLGNLLQREGPPERAIELIGQYLKRQPADRQQWELRLADHQVAAGDLDAAQRLLAGLAGQRQPEAQYALARLLLEQRHMPWEARQVLDRYAGSWNGTLRSDGIFLTAAVQAAAGQNDSALALLIPLAETGKDSGTRQQAYFRMAELEFARQNYDRAAELYGQVTKLGPAGDLVNDALSQLLLISANKTDRIAQLRTWSAARAAELRLDLKAAADSYRTLAASPDGGPLRDEAGLRLAELAEQRRDLRTAAQLYQQLGRSATDTSLAAEASYRAGKILSDRLGDTKQARLSWEQAILRYPDTSWSDLMRGELERSAPRKQE